MNTSTPSRPRSKNLPLYAILTALALLVTGVESLVAGCIGVQSCTHPACNPSSGFYPTGFTVYDPNNRENTSITDGEYIKSGGWNAEKMGTNSTFFRCTDFIAYYCARVSVYEPCTYGGPGGGGGGQ